MSKRKVLICDDKAIICTIVSEYLERMGFDVACVSDGKSCVDAVKNTNYELIILDVIMPEMDGPQTLKEIRKFSNVPVVMITGYNIDSLVQEGQVQPDKNVRFLRKPFRLNQVLEILNSSENKVSQMKNKRRILVVDDEKLLREMLCQTLENMGIEAQSASNGKECIQILSEQKNFDAIFLDIRMPDMDGLATIAELNRLNIKIPVVIMSGYSSIFSPSEAIEQGAAQFLVKPFDNKKIAECLRELDIKPE